MLRFLFNPMTIQLKKALRGVKVEVAHGESKRYRVSGITSQPTKKLK